MSETSILNSYLEQSGWSSNEDSRNLFQREKEVLVGGFIDGISQAGTNTVSDLKAAGKKFAANPLGATMDYLGDHWHEAVAGAAIAVVAPRKWLNAALFAYSMRGLATNTVHAGILAANPDNDVSSVRNFYSGAISHEGTAFMSSLPMTMVGGWAGKAGSNAVFGRNMGLSDALAGRVQWTDVKANLWNIRDTINPPKVRLLISDMDNTLLNFSKYMAIGVEEAIANLSKKLNKMGHPHSEQQLYELIGKRMDTARSHDYPWSVELALSERLNVGKPGGMTAQQFRQEISEPFWNTIDNSMSKHLELFPGVLSTLAELKQKGIKVAVLSDAPAPVALKRLTQAALDKHIERLYALDNVKEPLGLSGDLLALGRERTDAMLGLPNSLLEFRPISKAWEKPHVEGFQALMREYDVRPSQVLMIGDSRVKDLGVAHNAGAKGIWAKYGNPAELYEAILTRLRPLPENAPAPGAAPGAPRKYPPMLEAAESYSAVLKYLEPKPSAREIASALGRGLWVLPQWRSLAAWDNWPLVKTPESADR